MNNLRRQRLTLAEYAALWCASSGSSTEPTATFASWSRATATRTASTWTTWTGTASTSTSRTASAASITTSVTTTTTLRIASITHRGSTLGVVVIGLIYLLFAEPYEQMRKTSILRCIACWVAVLRDRTCSRDAVIVTAVLRNGFGLWTVDSERILKEVERKRVRVTRLAYI